MSDSTSSDAGGFDANMVLQKFDFGLSQYCANDNTKAESYWYRRFAVRCLNGEWFELSEVAMAESKSVSKMILDNEIS